MVKDTFLLPLAAHNLFLQDLEGCHRSQRLGRPRATGNDGDTSRP
jgi:hypothetical protein